MLTVAIVGRPNVGKSTVFNRLAGKNLAIVDNTPGVTRDWVQAESDFGGLALRIIDTAGFEGGPAKSLQARMLVQTKVALSQADVCLFLIDARAGVTPGDEIVAQALRKGGLPVVLAANKSESRAALAGQNEAYALGFGEPIALSAEHGLGFAELRNALTPFAQEDVEPEESSTARPLRLAIIGRPNVGKSSLLNRLLGEERTLTGPEAGITRDAVAASWQWQGREILLHDTAGLRKKARIDQRLEKLSVDSTLNAIRFADCVILVMDCGQPFEKQDLTIAALVAREGRALVVAVNKWDLMKEGASKAKELQGNLDRLLPQVAGTPLIAISAKTGEGMEHLMPAIAGAEQVWNKRVPTAELNRFLHQALQRHPPPAIKGRRIRLRYMTQAKARPPTFVLFGNQLKALPESYLRYLAHGLREAFELPGTPIRFNTRTSHNPYTE